MNRRCSGLCRQLAATSLSIVKMPPERKPSAIGKANAFLPVIAHHADNPCQTESEAKYAKQNRYDCKDGLHTPNDQNSDTRDQKSENREAELEPPSRVACSDLLGGSFM